MIRKIVIFGPQGSGKGTQGEMLAQRLNLVYIATGNMFRSQIHQDTELGREAEHYISQGHLVPDELTNGMIKKRLSEPDMAGRGFILDGYPRNKSQDLALEAMLDITDAVVIDISDKEAIMRIAGRLSCVCGKTYHKKFNPPKKRKICDNCGRKLFVRDDDKPRAIKKRLALYHSLTKPLFSLYEKEGILRHINGQQPIADVHQSVLKALGVA